MPDPVTILAATSTVMNIIAAHNTSDGGQGAIALATLQYLRNTADRLDQVQDQLNDLLKQVSQLTIQQQKALRTESQFQNRMEVLKATNQFTKLMLEAGSEDYETWRRSPNVVRTLGELENVLDHALAAFEEQNMYDALTALHVPMLAHVHLAVRVALDYCHDQLLQRARFFLEYFARVGDGQQVGSTSEQLHEAMQRHTELLSTPELAPIRALLSAQQKNSATVCAPVVFIEVVPEHEETRLETVWETDTRYKKVPVPFTVPAQYFNWRVLNFECDVEEVSSDAGFKEWRLSQLKHTGGAAGEFAKGFPYDMNQLNTPDNLQPIVSKVPKGQLHDTTHEKPHLSRASARLQKIIEKAALLNSERMTMVLCAQALASAEVARTKLIETLGVDLIA